MFADPFCEFPWATSSRRAWTTLMSFGAQIIGLGMLLMLPLFYTERLPALRWMTAPISTPAPRVPAPAMDLGPTRHSAAGSSELLNGIPVQPQRIPRGTPRIDDVNIPPDPANSALRPGSSNGSFNGVLNSILIGTPFVPLLPPKPVTRPPRISTMMEGNLVHRVQPTYPPIAKAAGIQGAVVLRAVISKEGTIENLSVQSGHPLLVKAALEAVSQWRYRPYLLNGDPFEVETQVMVNFVLNR